MHWLVSILGILIGMTLGVDCYRRIAKKEICSGSSFYFEHPLSIRSEHLYLIYYKGGVERKIANSLESLDPQYPWKDDKPYIPEVMRKHEGEYYWRATNVHGEVSRFMLVLKNCTHYEYLDYGKVLSLSVPADTHVLEFTPKGSYDSYVLWSRINVANQRGARGTFSVDPWKGVWKTHKMTQDGRYVLRRKSGGLISITEVKLWAILLEGHVADYQSAGACTVSVDIPAHELQVIYTPSAKGNYDENYETKVLFANGLNDEEGFMMFGDRIRVKASGESSEFSILEVEPSDAGRYKFLNKNGHTVKTLTLKSDNEFNPRSLIEPLGIAAGVIVGLACCCWCCCKCCRDSDKDETTAASPEEAPPVYIHDTTVLSGPGQPLQPSSSIRNLTPLSGDMWQSNPPPYRTVIHNEVPAEGGAPGAAAAGGGGAGGDNVPPSAPTPPPAYPAPQYQPVAWSSGMGDFLSYSPLSVETSGATAAADDTTYTSNKLNF